MTESAPPPRPTSVTTTLTALDNTDGSVTDTTKTYYITYTYFNTFLEKGSTVVRTNVATSTDVVLEKVPVRKTTMKTAPVNPTQEPIQIFATKTYLTTFTYFTTLLQVFTILLIQDIYALHIFKISLLSGWARWRNVNNCNVSFTYR